MGQPADFWTEVQKLSSGQGGLRPEAYAFIMQSLDFTMRGIGVRRHVSASELLDGLCNYARERFGLMASEVLRRWGISSPSDVGRAVFQMIDAEILARQPSDRREDFDIAYDLRAKLEEDYFS